MSQVNKRYQQRYDVWAGNPNGIAPDYTRCCEIVSNGIGRVKQCSRKRCAVPDSAYCKQHSTQFENTRELS